MGILIFLAIFFLISLVFGLVFSIILMNLRIIEIPPKYSWMNALIFIKKNAVKGRFWMGKKYPSSWGKSRMKRGHNQIQANARRQRQIERGILAESNGLIRMRSSNVKNL